MTVDQEMLEYFIDKNEGHIWCWMCAAYDLGVTVDPEVLVMHFVDDTNKDEPCVMCKQKIGRVPGMEPSLCCGTLIWWGDQGCPCGMTAKDIREKQDTGWVSPWMIDVSDNPYNRK